MSYGRKATRTYSRRLSPGSATTRRKEPFKQQGPRRNARTPLDQKESEKEFWDDVRAYRRKEPELATDPRYRGKFVAFRGGAVVDSDTDEAELLERVDSRFGAVPVLIHKVGRKRVIHVVTPYPSFESAQKDTG